MASRNLVAQGPHHLGAWADPSQTGGDDSVGKFRVFRQKAVARVNGIDPGRARDAQDVFGVEVSRQWLLAFADQITFIGLEAVQRLPVLLRVDAHGANAHLGRSAHDADRYLGSVGDQYRSDRVWLHRRAPECEGLCIESRVRARRAQTFRSALQIVLYLMAPTFAATSGRLTFCTTTRGRAGFSVGGKIFSDQRNA